MEYTDREFMTIVAARQIKDHDIVFSGTGISLLAATMAKMYYSPECTIFYETGAIDPEILEIPMSVADSRVMYKSSINAGLFESFCLLQNRFTRDRIISILGAAQIDKYGNLNTTCIGDYDNPQVRFPGSGGSCDAASFTRYIVFLAQEKRRFVRKLDYLTSPGYLSGGESRKKAGYESGGPEAVVTNMGLFKFNEETKEMYLDQFRADVGIEDIRRRMEFEVDTSRAREIDSFSEEALETLRNEVDPKRLILE